MSDEEKQPERGVTLPLVDGPLSQAAFFREAWWLDSNSTWLR